MELKAQRRLAARIMKCGESRVWMDPARLGEISEAITAGDVRRLVRDGIVASTQKTGVSKSRAGITRSQKKRGRQKGKGSRKGSLGTRFSRKRAWIARVRAQRKLLREMLEAGSIEKNTYKDLYRKSGGGFFRSRAHLMGHVEETRTGKETGK